MAGGTGQIAPSTPTVAPTADPSQGGSKGTATAAPSTSAPVLPGNTYSNMFGQAMQQSNAPSQGGSKGIGTPTGGQYTPISMSQTLASHPVAAVAAPLAASPSVGSGGGGNSGMSGGGGYSNNGMGASSENNGMGANSTNGDRGSDGGGDGGGGGD